MDPWSSLSLRRGNQEQNKRSRRVGDMKEGSSREWWSDFCDRDQQRMHHWDVLQLSSGAASGPQSQFISHFPAKTRWRGNIKMAHAQSALQQVGKFTTKASLQQFMKKIRGKICTIPARTISQRIPQGCPQQRISLRELCPEQTQAIPRAGSTEQGPWKRPFRQRASKASSQQRQTGR